MPKKLVMLPKKSKDKRVLALEGVRGVAGVMVVLFHSIISMYPTIHWGDAQSVVQHMKYEDNIFGSFIYAFINGSFAVSIFFILSGFVLSVGFFSKRNMSEAYGSNLNQALKRYFRLMIPALASVLVAFFILYLGLNFNQQAFDITGSPRLHDAWPFEPNLLKAIWQGLVGIFYEQIWYNPVLWTMYYEFLGSFLVFGLLAIFGKSKSRFIVYVVLFVILAHSLFLGFLIGMIIADLYINKKMPKVSLKLGLLLILFGLMLGSFNPYYDGGLTLILGNLSGWKFTWYFIGGTIIIITGYQVTA